MNRPTLSVLIPAAGASKRLGQAKQLVEYRGMSLIQNAIELAYSVTPAEIIVVTGANEEAVKAAVQHQPTRWVHNPQLVHWNGCLHSPGYCFDKSKFNRLDDFAV